MEEIKVGYCVAYDWKMLRFSIPQIYEDANVICLAVDIKRQSWAGKPFSWDEAGFRKLVSDLDPLKKIMVYEDNFYNPDLLPMANEVAQRNMIAAFLGDGGWHVQLDADEYFLDFKGFVAFLRKHKSKRKENICCPMLNLYKQSADGMLWIKPSKFSEVEFFPIATRAPLYVHGRRNGYFNILTSFSILHQSWAREETEIWEKLKNWGHSKDFNVEEYFQKWKNVNGGNFKQYKNFHHLYSATWPALELVPGTRNIEDLMRLGGKNFLLPITKIDLYKVNSIWLSRVKKVANMILMRKF